MATDPVCHMEVDEKESKVQSKYQGQNYYFCSEDCKGKFDEEPAKYAKKTA